MKNQKCTNIKFEVTKTGTEISIRIIESNKPDRLITEVPKGRVFIRGSSPDKIELFATFKAHVAAGSFSSIDQVCDEYHRSMKDKLKEDMKDLFKAYLKVKKTVDCLDLADEIRLEPTAVELT